MSIFSALGVGSTALVARFVGGKDYDSANKVAQQAMNLAVALALFFTALMFYNAEFVPRAMGAAQDVIPAAALYLRIISVAFLFLCPPLSSPAFSGGPAIPWPPLAIAAIGVVVFRLGLAWMLVNVFHLGLMGAWLALVLDFWARGVLSFLRFRAGYWQKI